MRNLPFGETVVAPNPAASRLAQGNGELAAIKRRRRIGVYVVRLKGPAGCKIAPHTHPNEENVTVLQLHGVGPQGVTYVDPADDPRKY
jgi:hypothetical protein